MFYISFTQLHFITANSSEFMNVKGKEWRMIKILNNIFNVNKLKKLFEKTHKKLGSVVKLRHENAQNAKTDQLLTVFETIFLTKSIL